MLPPTSLILKIWTAWGEEQDCVSFTVKRVKRREGEVVVRKEGEAVARREEGVERKEGEEGMPQRDGEDGVARRRVRRRSSKAGDTLHPKALARDR